jgi:L-gulonate 3-dehydrogenase
MPPDASPKGVNAMKIAVVGAGLIGRAWAISFARAGHEVALWDPDPNASAAAREAIAVRLPELAENGLLDEPEAAVLARIASVSTLDAALAGAAHVQENAPERLEAKRELFAQLDALADPRATLASSTSALLPSAFTEALSGRARALVAHPINPPYLIPAVEIVPAPWTDAAVVERTAALMRAAGHVPIVMGREIDGFVVNRLQGALLDEAFRLVEQGFASPDDVDAAVRDGLALRWSFMGPFETIDLNAPQGVRDYVARYAGAYKTMFAGYSPRPNWEGVALDRVEAARRARLPAARLGERAAWRDRRLAALLAHRRNAARKLGD